MREIVRVFFPGSLMDVSPFLSFRMRAWRFLARRFRRLMSESYMVGYHTGSDEIVGQIVRGTVHLLADM